MASNDVMNVAMEWVVTMKTSADAERLRPELEAWFLQEPRHRIAYERAERQWTGLHKAVILLQQKGPMPPEVLLSEIDDVARLSRRRRQVRSQVRNCSIALAALSACVLVAFAIRHWSAPPASVAWVEYASGNGTFEPHTLEDGSGLLLNDNSAARVRITRAIREVALDRGELLVRVKHDGKRPFLVRAGDIVLRAVGTEFSVRREATGDLQATVREGKVEIVSTGVSAPEPAAPKSSERTPLLSAAQPAIVRAGQTATISGGQVRVESQDPTEIENRLAWVHGRLYLHGTLARAVEQFNEHNEDKIVIADASIGTIGNINVTGLYDCHDIHEFAESLRPRGVRYRVEKAPGFGKDIIVLSAGK
jgi:transmembrane sensor